MRFSQSQILLKKNMQFFLIHAICHIHDIVPNSAIKSHLTCTWNCFGLISNSLSGSWDCYLLRFFPSRARCPCHLRSAFVASRLSLRE